MWNWGGCVELRGFWCWTEGFLGLKRCGPLVELMCWTEGYSNWHYLNTPLVHKHWFYSKYVEAEFKGKDANLWRRVGCSENLGTLFWSKHYFKWIVFVLTFDKLIWFSFSHELLLPIYDNYVDLATNSKLIAEGNSLRPRFLSHLLINLFQRSKDQVRQSIVGHTLRQACFEIQCGWKSKEPQSLTSCVKSC